MWTGVLTRYRRGSAESGHTDLDEAVRVRYILSAQNYSGLAGTHDGSPMQTRLLGHLSHWTVFGVERPPKARACRVPV